MCGIFVALANRATPHLTPFFHLQDHRGPDENAILFESPLALGHQRLAIQDLSPNGSQPMRTPDGRFTIVFNGEIYNHLDIRRQLLSHVSFRGHSDTETLLHTFATLGLDALPKLNGIFTFAVFDKRSQKLTIARDPLGVKPAYFYSSNDEFFLASELKSLAFLPGIDKSLNHQAISNYLTFLWSPGEQTPFAKIKKLEAGHFLEIDLTSFSGSVRPQQYYELPFSGERTSFRSTDDCVDQLDSLLQQTVKRQLLADVPVGFFLSGGLDSSLLAAIARKQIGESFRCYTIGNPNEGGPHGKTSDGFVDDFTYAQKVAQSLDLDLQVVDGNHEVLDHFDEMIWHLDEPQADVAPLHVRNICRHARSLGDIVLIGGTAADDLFSGYRRHQAESLERFLSWIPTPIQSALRSLGGYLPNTNPTARRAKKLLLQLGKQSLERAAGFYTWLDKSRVAKLFDRSIQCELKDYDPSNCLIQSLAKIPDESSLLNQMLFWDLKYFLADHNLNYTDKMSMAEGVEVRVPYLDLDLVKFACELPINLKMRGKTTKYILRKVAERYLPHDVIYRPKTGFGGPVRKWLVDGKLDVRFRNLQQHGFEKVFDTNAVNDLVQATKRGETDGSYSLLAVLAVDSWMNQFMGDGSAKIRRLVTTAA
ncbi:Asparagine synthetase 1 [Pirellula sp. SH-Sr6A]|uniref:asparagine synthase (glutamine-hydrolyzing) n=1 Tax=Pirellula sp. SH-Sr6A TaxID=1632865 RepID=UPI00078EC1F6|nr:asparagine synthase (glutamine-hydrolyzing) [Pirellula sp. SH-Sr6A]AMV31843.1 Asparagine synthetase 1 [Pirellula sp. SH-Sr6A]